MYIGSSKPDDIAEYITDTRLQTPDFRHQTSDTRLQTQDFRHKTSDTRLQTQDFRHKTSDTRQKHCTSGRQSPTISRNISREIRLQTQDIRHKFRFFSTGLYKECIHNFSKCKPNKILFCAYLSALIKFIPTIMTVNQINIRQKYK